MAYDDLERRQQQIAEKLAELDIHLTAPVQFSSINGSSILVLQAEDRDRDMGENADADEESASIDAEFESIIGADPELSPEARAERKAEELRKQQEDALRELQEWGKDLGEDDE